TKSEEIAWKKYKEVLLDKRETEAVIRSIAEGLVVVDIQGNVVMMNPAAEKLLGVSYKEKAGKSILEGLKEEQIVSMVKDLPHKENREIEVFSPKEETKKILRASSAVIEDENGKPIGMVSILSDATKQKELDRLKSNFVSNVTHELRTPLVAIEKSISLLLTQDLSESQQREFLSIAQRNLKRLTLLINDLLDLSKLEAGKMEIKRQPSHISNIIDETVSGLDSWAKTKSLVINKIVGDNLPQINVDPNRIIQVLTNLIGNAIKFTPQGGTITVKAHWIEKDDELEVSVEDTGIGIAKEDLVRIFDKFFQVGERAPTDISGTGIGLSIVKEIIQLHGGKIWAESEKGKGAKFIFRLPLS
ncbi:MAG: cell wall metabolism sensor histidine kinase WalK, partial [Candidatus Omnitrophica bacterium]|nr:cell wall metabolism sensor histidine kinase WalK [Candidatus Omnitrophota bacterium]